MADVFISYSRKDKDFVRKFHDALAKSNRDTWVDWEDIPLTATWLDEIFAGIEAADNFVFVISPESVASATCRDEIVHASSNNKRLIPILHRTVPTDAVPAALAKINWIFFRDSDPFDIAFASLIHALDTDLNWKRAHTRLLVRAKEWEREANDGSFLLRGKDLQEAEGWVAQGAERDPKPTALQSQYVVAGRRAATRRQRITLGAVTVAFAVAVVLAIMALGQRNIAQTRQKEAEQATAREGTALKGQTAARQEAEQQRDEANRQRQLADERREEAEEQARIANSRRLAATALLNKDDHLDLASLLSIEARHTLDTVEARNALFSTFELSPNLRIYLHHPAGVKAVAFSHDSRMLASAGEDGYVRLWDVATGQLMGSPLRGHRGIVNSVAFSPDGKMLASGGHDDRVLLWDVTSGKAISEVVLGKGGPVEGVTFSADGTLLAAAKSNVVLVWRLPSGTPVGRPLIVPAGLGPDVSIYAVALSPDDRFVAAGGTQHKLWLWDLHQPQMPGKSLEGHTDTVFSVAFSPGGKLLASAGTDGTIRLWNVASGLPFGEPLRGHDGGVITVLFSRNGKQIVSAGVDQTVRRWDVARGRQAGAPMLTKIGPVDSAAFSPDDGTLAGASEDHTVRLWDLRGGHSLERDLAGHDKTIRSLAFSPDGRTLASGSDDKTIRLWDAASGQPIGEPLKGHSGPVVTVSFSSDGEALTSAGLDQSVQRWDVPHRKLLGEILRQQGGFALAIAASRNGRFVSVAVGKAVLLWDFIKRTQFTVHSQSSEIVCMTFSPDSKILAFGGDDGTVGLWDVEPMQRVPKSLAGGQNGVQSLAFSGDGRTLASGGDDGTVRLWDVARDQPLGEPLKGHSSPLSSLAFSPNGKILASASIDATVRLWDLEGNEFFGEPLKGHRGYVWALAFSPDGKILASGGKQTVRLWNLDEEAWIARGCALANRNLTLAEWRHYFDSGIVYHRTCPKLPPGEGVPASFQ
jgi:WD40 repeat protein